MAGRQKGREVRACGVLGWVRVQRSHPGSAPTTLDVILPGNGGPAAGLNIGREEEGPGRGRWAESGCTQGGVRGVSTCRIAGGQA